MKLVKLQEKQVKIPEHWAEVPFSKFLKYFKLTKSFKTEEEQDAEYGDSKTKEFKVTLDNLNANTKTICFWTGLSEEEISMCNIEDVSEVMTDLKFMTEAYHTMNINSFKFKGEEYFVPEIGMKKQTFGSYIEAEQVELNNKELEDGKLQALPRQIAILCKKKEEVETNLSDDVIDEREKLFKELDMATIWDVGFFLTKHETRLLSSTLMYLKQEKQLQQKK
tara:strand:- start:17106 stop:17771 length:666 start_codon:yes stop_codon:yes gene_type:complete